MRAFHAGCVAAAVWLGGFVALPAEPLSAQPRIAEQVAFAVPLRDGDTGSALVLPAAGDQLLIVAAPGNPPVIATYRISGDAPQPEPGPGPQPDPQPDPQPKPVGKLQLLWIEETADRTPEQAQAIVDPDIREALRDAGWSLRVVDDDVVDENGETPAELAPYIAEARRAGLPRLIAIDTAGAEVFSGKAPADLPGFKAILQRLGLQVTRPLSQAEPKAQPRDFPAQQKAQREDVQAEPKPTAKQVIESQTSGCATGNCPTYVPSTRRWIRVIR